jgi:hypothetical protein
VGHETADSFYKIRSCMYMYSGIYIHMLLAYCDMSAEKQGTALQTRLLLGNGSVAVT